MADGQKFYATLNIETEPGGKKLSEAGLRMILRKALDRDKMDDRISSIRFGDVIEMPNKGGARPGPEA